MNKCILRTALTVFLLLTAVSCRDRSLDERDPVKVSHSVTIQLEPGKWLYYSISDNRVVGRGIIGNALDDEEWKNRKDWDIALCETGIRTNGGTSGCGRGGLAIITDSEFNEESYLPLTSLDYTEDSNNVQTVIPLANSVTN